MRSNPDRLFVSDWEFIKSPSRMYRTVEQFFPERPGRGQSNAQGECYLVDQLPTEP